MNCCNAFVRMLFQLLRARRTILMYSFLRAWGHRVFSLLSFGAAVFAPCLLLSFGAAVHRMDVLIVFSDAGLRCEPLFVGLFETNGGSLCTKAVGPATWPMWSGVALFCSQLSFGAVAVDPFTNLHWLSAVQPIGRCLPGLQTTLPNRERAVGGCICMHVLVPAVRIRIGAAAGRLAIVGLSRLNVVACDRCTVVAVFEWRCRMRQANLTCCTSFRCASPHGIYRQLRTLRLSFSGIGNRMERTFSVAPAFIS